MNTTSQILLLAFPGCIILGLGLIFIMLQNSKKRNMKTILVDAWNAFITESGVDKEMQKILDRFPNKKIILTNANNEEKLKFGMVNMPYEVFSLEHNPNKPDPEYYKKMLSNFRLDSTKVIYFEHNPDAVKSAESVGIKTMWFDKEKRDLGELEMFLKDNI